MDNDINREINIEQVEFGINIDNIEYSIEINPRDTFTIQLNEQGPQGARGYTGNGISSYELTSTVGLTDTYTITFTDGNTTTVDVTNGRGITSITGPVSVGNIDTYTINYNDSTTSTFTIANGIDGVNPTVTVGTTTTGNPGTNASVVNSGTTQDVVLDFTIPRGDKGETGEDGNDGFSPIATVSKVGDTATISITDINGTTTTTISDGTDGTDGTDGAAATISVGTVTTGNPGTNASVINSGTSSAAVFDFTIPRGDKGDTGNTGATGNGIASISKTSTVDLVDTYTITYTNGNTDTFTVTNGEKGDTGSTGTAATIAVGTVSTGAAGSSASVVNSGTSSAAVFDFTIPRGDTGATGTSVTGVTLESTSGLQKTYRMSFSDGSHFDYVVTDGAAGATTWGGISGTLSNQTDLQNALNAKQNVIDSNNKLDYAYLSNTPTIPIVNNATLTIQKNETDVQTFTANASSNVTANITVPTDTSDLTNNAGFITSSALSGYATETWVGNQGYLTSIPSSYLQNTATGTDSLTIDGTANSSNSGVNIGKYSSINNGINSTAIGYYATSTYAEATAIGAWSSAAWQWSTAIGALSEATGSGSTSVGYKAISSASNAIQIGWGTNSTANTLQVGFNNTSYQLLDGTTGKIPNDRLNLDQTFDGTSANAQSGVSVLSLLETIYPVGALYISTTSTCPLASLFGTWTLVAQDKALWTGDGTNADTTIAAGLPNIKGNFTPQFTVAQGINGDGAISAPYTTATGGRFGNTAVASGWGYGFKFNAALYNSIYSDSVTTVQPPAYVVNVWKRTA